VRERHIAAVIGSRRQHRRGGSGPNGDSVRLVRAVGNRGQRIFVQTIDPSHHGLRQRWVGAQSDEHVVGGGGDRGINRRRRRRRLQVGQERLVPAFDGVDGVVDRPLDHRHVQHRETGGV
jgi:hypothetical protein